ncbi:hypothetical protein ACLIOB_001183 [Vibrio cholerae]|uniref:hypothetical protein n=1 Tax=Vibrio cholerae TaxID=666 RepID=UPI0012EB2647|nr:hypothetical protein [Vibrio cholerae]MCX9472302.1 hypothetical protein [Vibrio cholerae]MCX9484175.1 hypothetical protein [Vibrio cholerae]MCX9491235.1 hypothetical protein [Vibrio cholerae]MVB21196.1 hypothetical protein [Vibrio cholerae]MVB49190.1 hypothetical protein [Vibrio cholerae]
MYATYWKQLTNPQREALASKLDTSVGYLRLVLSGHKIAGPMFAKKLHDETSGEVDKQVLRPDIF